MATAVVRSRRSVLGRVREIAESALVQGGGALSFCRTGACLEIPGIRAVAVLAFVNTAAADGSGAAGLRCIRVVLKLQAIVRQEGQEHVDH